MVLPPDYWVDATRSETVLASRRVQHPRKTSQSDISKLLQAGNTLDWWAIPNLANQEPCNEEGEMDMELRMTPLSYITKCVARALNYKNPKVTDRPESFKNRKLYFKTETPSELIRCWNRASDHLWSQLPPPPAHLFAANVAARAWWRHASKEDGCQFCPRKI